jgi:hypothetical protein
MPKDSTKKKSSHKLRHAPLAIDMEQPIGKLRPPRPSQFETADNDNDESEAIALGGVLSQAREQRQRYIGDDEIDEGFGFGEMDSVSDDEIAEVRKLWRYVCRLFS